MTNRVQKQDRTGAKLSVTNPSENHHRACQLRPFADLTEIVFLHSHFVLVSAYAARRSNSPVATCEVDASHLCHIWSPADVVLNENETSGVHLQASWLLFK